MCIDFCHYVFILEAYQNISNKEQQRNSVGGVRDMADISQNGGVYQFPMCSGQP